MGLSTSYFSHDHYFRHLSVRLQNLHNFISNLDKVDTLLASPPSIASCFQSVETHWRAAAHSNRRLSVAVQSCAPASVRVLMDDRLPQDFDLQLTWPALWSDRPALCCSRLKWQLLYREQNIERKCCSSIIVNKKECLYTLTNHHPRIYLSLCVCVCECVCVYRKGIHSDSHYTINVCSSTPVVS